MDDPKPIAAWLQEAERTLGDMPHEALSALTLGCTRAFAGFCELARLDGPARVEEDIASRLGEMPSREMAALLAPLAALAALVNIVATSRERAPRHWNPAGF